MSFLVRKTSVTVNQGLDFGNRGAGDNLGILLSESMPPRAYYLCSSNPDSPCVKWGLASPSHTSNMCVALVMFLA